MCGIFSILNHDGNELTTQFIQEQFNKGKNRGPEYSKMATVMIRALFGFHRLAINGLNSDSNQPIIYSDVALICNGEIYNYRELYKTMKVEPKTDSDCEVIIHLYLKYGIEQTLQMLDGVFSFILIDYRYGNLSSKIYIARDPYGVRPLYYLKSEELFNTSSELIINRDVSIFGFASELKMLTEIKKQLNTVEVKKNATFFKLYGSYRQKKYDIYQFTPGTYSMFELSHKVCAEWEPSILNALYHKMPFSSNMLVLDNKMEIYKNIQYYFGNAIEKRCSTTERPIACLLSGGLDSSLVAALVNEYHVLNNLPTIETYSIGLEGSVDLKYARIVADYLGTKHTEIVLTEQDFLNAIPDVIYAIESFDTTTVRASIGNWLLGKYISEHSQAKVIFNGDGSDELAGGYLYMNYTPDSIEYDKECRRLLTDIHTFDVLRSDKSISSHGLEPRTPFLDRAWTQYYLSIPIDIRNHTIENNMEKYLIRKAFDKDRFLNSDGFPLLPNDVLWRRKEAFSDGVSKHTRSLYEIIQEYTLALFIRDELPLCPFIANSENMFEHLTKLTDGNKVTNIHLIPKTAEQFYYRKIFETYYEGMANIIPYFWMPRFIEATDASARTLSIYASDSLV